METSQHNKLVSQLTDLLEHKKFILTSCNKVAQWLFDNKQDELALGLIHRALVHDNSKFENDELSYLMQLSEHNDSMTNPHYIMTDADKKCIETHWKHNRHHPEYHESIYDMTELDIIEMVCDWYARSLQLKTNFMEFVYTRQENRFHFPEEIFNIVLKYCNIVSKESE